MAVTYVKNPEKAQIPPVPSFAAEPLYGQAFGPTTIRVNGGDLMRDLVNPSQSSLLQPPSRDIPPRPIPTPPPTEALAAEVTQRTSKRRKHESVGGYDKSTIEGVQVSVLIAMPQRSTSTRRHTLEFAGPIELGVVNIPLGHSAPRWAARHSIHPPPQ